MKTFALACLVCLLPVASRAEARLETWAVVGIGMGAETVSRDELEEMRGALGLELSARGKGVVRDEESARLRLGLPGASLRAVRDRIDAAELYYFQLELEVARRQLEQALEELAHAGGVPEAWEWTRLSHMLLGMIHLAGRAPDARARAAEHFAAIARVQPGWSPAAASYPAEVVELFGEVRRGLDRERRGALRARCKPACPEGHVFVETFPVGVPDEVLSLPPGRYRVVVTDRFERPTRRSLLREVELQPGEEVTVEVDLEMEALLSLGEGPTVRVDGDAAAMRRAAAETARRVGADHTLVLLAPSGPRRAAWVFDRAGAALREVETEAGPDAIATLAHLVASDANQAARPAVASLDLSLAAAPLPTAPAASRPSPLLGAARWSSVGGAVAAATVGTWLRLDAAGREDALQGRVERSGGAFATEREARAAREENRAIAAQARWGNGLLVGAGVLSATAITLFLLDAEVEGGAVRW